MAMTSRFSKILTQPPLARVNHIIHATLSGQ